MIGSCAMQTFLVHRDPRLLLFTTLGSYARQNTHGRTLKHSSGPRGMIAERGSDPRALTRHDGFNTHGIIVYPYHARYSPLFIGVAHV